MSVGGKRAVAWFQVVLALAAWGMAVLIGCTSGGSSSTSCPDTKINCGDGCVDTKSDGQNCGGCGQACPAGQVCSNGACAIACYNGTSACGQSCVNLQDDPQNCGTCMTACKGGEVCSMGKCALTCGGGTSLCGSSCKDLNVDPNNCGGCGMQCASGEMCNAGMCSLMCAAGYTSCSITVKVQPDAGARDATTDATVDAGKQDSGGVNQNTAICVNLKTDVNNCGKCGFGCPSGEACVLGTCSVSCQKSETNCNGQCTNTATDDLNCGGCGNKCNNGQVCSGGQCGVTCQNGYNVCPNGDAGVVCSDPNTDPNNCGGCGLPCMQGYSCVAGFCQIVCPNGYSLCGQQCFDEMNDVNHCGNCFTTCIGSQQCTQGICCNPGLVNCSQQCTDTTSDPNNCGGCGTVCSGATPYCSNSACQQCPPGGTLVNGHCQIVYSITKLDSAPNMCGSYTYSCGGSWGFHWTDVANGATVTSVAIAMEGGLECAAGTRTLDLNGTAVGTFTTVNDCSCLATPVQWNVNAAPLTPYVVNGMNSVLIAVTSCEGLEPNGNWNGASAQVTVRY